MAKPVSNKMENIGQKIRTQRQLAGLTQYKLGMLAFGLRKNQAQVKIKNFELGYGRIPSCKEISKICDVLKISEDDLFNTETLEGNIPPTTLTHPTLTNVMPEAPDYLQMFNIALNNNDLRLYLEILKSFEARLTELLKDK